MILLTSAGRSSGFTAKASTARPPLADRYVALARQRYGEEHTEHATAIAWLATVYHARVATPRPLSVGAGDARSVTHGTRAKVRQVFGHARVRWRVLFLASASS